MEKIHALFASLITLFLSFTSNYVETETQTTNIGTTTVAVINSNNSQNSRKTTLLTGEPTTGTSSLDKKDYLGAWFKITYPANFTAEATGTSANQKNSDEAIFTSPDKTVQFYVYSPQWSGDPISYINLIRAVDNSNNNEVLIDLERKEEVLKDSPYNLQITRWATFAAKDGSYKRSVVSIKTGSTDGWKGDRNDSDPWENFHVVFGIKYSNETAYKKYLKEYLDFKKSLVQYAD